MKKRLISIMSVMILVLMLGGCGNKQFLDTTYTFRTAIIEMPDGTVKELSVQSWADYEDGDQIQIKATDGVTYLVHSSKCVLLTD